jgi:hypothetical protein
MRVSPDTKLSLPSRASAPARMAACAASGV